MINLRRKIERKNPENKKEQYFHNMGSHRRRFIPADHLQQFIHADVEDIKENRRQQAGKRERERLQAKLCVQCRNCGRNFKVKPETNLADKVFDHLRKTKEREIWLINRGECPECRDTTQWSVAFDQLYLSHNPGDDKEYVRKIMERQKEELKQGEAISNMLGEKIV